MAAVSSSAWTRLVLMLSLCCICLGDIYMHNMRGSNNRWAQLNRNRLFNSQNNDNGGYCWGPPLSFYAGSHLPIEWTAQHSCGGGSKVKCNIVLQYMCGSTTDTDPIRDGLTNDEIPDDATAYKTMQGDDYTYGMHESYQYYQNCKGRSRNSGLFTADQNINPFIGATSTRQNNNGNRYGFECPEERDYYPYWAPTPWKDIAILTHDNDVMCHYFQSQSQNVKSKQYCSGNNAITKQECVSKGGQWLSQNSWGIGKPSCKAAPYSRDNHLGNTVGGHPLYYNWTLPTSHTEKCIDDNSCACVLRIRYNMTSHEIDGYGQDDGTFTDSSANKAPPMTQDPYVMIAGRNLSLAANTNQYGRTFQDRSHVFKIVKRPSGVSDGDKIYNINVRGKRGNIVQVYPAVEYDFVPNALEVKKGDYVHFHWTGCDTNPNNDGEGTASTDRSNVAQIKGMTYNYPITDDQWASSEKNTKKLFESSDKRQLMAHLGVTDDQCQTLDQLQATHGADTNGIEQDPQNCAKLNSAPANFDGGLVQMNNEGKFYYMSTRNNNFSNRSQKGMINVEPKLQPWQIALISVGCVVFTSLLVVGALVVYAKKNPHSKVAEKVDGLLNLFRR